MNAARELAQLVERSAKLGLAEQVGCAVRLVPELRAHELQYETEPEQVLLRAVMEIPLEASPFFVPRRDDAWRPPRTC